MPKHLTVIDYDDGRTLVGLPTYRTAASTSNVDLNNYTHLVETGNVVESYYLTSIPNDWRGNPQFTWTTNPSYLSIGNYVTSIGVRAFRSIEFANSDLVIPPSVTSIGNDAFRNCYTLQGKLVLSEGLQTIGQTAFRMDRDFNNPSNKLYFGATNPITVYGFQSGGLYFPASLISIDNSAFQFQEQLVGPIVFAGNNLTTIGLGAFAQCRNLEGDIIIPTSVSSIGNSAFQGSRTFGATTGNLVLDRIAGSPSITIGINSFASCAKINDIYLNIPASSFIGTNALSNCGVGGFLYVHPDHVSGYDATWKSAQAYSGTVTTWTNYPNIPN